MPTPHLFWNILVRRVISLYLPQWPIDRYQRRHGSLDDAAILLTRLDHGRQIIVHHCRRSRQRGVTPGMTLAHARALLPGIRVIDAAHEPTRDQTALRALAMWCMRFTPLTAVDGCDGLLLDVTGCMRIYGDERRLMNIIGNTIERLGIMARLACADTIGCAWAMSRFGTHDRTTVYAGQQRAVLEPLPIEALRIDRATIEALHEVSVDRVADVLALPRLELAARFDGLLLRRIDQILGDATEIIDALAPHEPIIAERGFDGAITQLETLLIAAGELLDEIIVALERRASGAMHLHLAVHRLGSPAVHVRMRLSRPSRDRRHLGSLLQPRIERVHMGFGVERITLEIIAAHRMPHQQDAHWTDHSGEAQAIDRASGELIDALAHRLGMDRTLRMRLHASHLPERMATYLPAIEPMPPMTDICDASFASIDCPSHLLDRPEPIDIIALTPDGPPMQLRWRGVEHRVTSSRGPHRISAEWWRDADSHHTREYFAVQDEQGNWLWVFRAIGAAGAAEAVGVAGGRWFIHGRWL